MQYIKKILVIKELIKGYSILDRSLSGISRIEVENGVAQFFLSLVNFNYLNNGDYYAFILDSKNELFSFELEKLPSSFSQSFDKDIDISCGYAIGIVALIDNLPTTVAFSKDEKLSTSISDFKKLVAEHFLHTLKKTNDNSFSQYDDEAVATENYYSIDDKISEKLSELDNIDNSILKKDNKDDSLSNENGNTINKSQEKEKKIPFTFDLFENEKSNEDESQSYYESAKAELDELFLKFPPELSLNESFPNSKFVKIKYSNDKYYVVGIIKEKNKVKYICYGVPSAYSKDAPPELQPYSVFVPISIYNENNDGFFMMFQDANSGECIKKIEK